MTNLTLAELFGTALAIPCFLAIMIPPGFLLGWGLNAFAFRRRSSTEQLLWAVTLSLPLDLVLVNVPARYLPAAAPLLLLLLLDLAAIALALRLARHGQLTPLHLKTLDRPARLILASLAGLLLYLLFAGLPLELHHRLFEPVFSSDWEIRFPLIRAALHDGVPPRNPFFTFRGTSPVSQYYFYWFSLCGQVLRLTHTDARCVLLASSFYAALCLLATVFLCLKHLTPGGNLRRQCLVLMGLCCVLGLDVLPSTVGLFMWHTPVRPELEWWLPDRSPGLVGALLYAPHHIAGAACGFLLVLLCHHLLTATADRPRPAVALYGSLLGLTFAAMVGTSTFITLFFAVACSVFFLYALTLRDLRLPAALLLAALLSLAVSLPFLHEVTAKTTAYAGAKPSPHLLGFALRDSEYAHFIMTQAAKRLHVPLPGRILRFFLRSSIILGLIVTETGFFLLVAVFQFRHDLRSGRPLSVASRLLWLLAASVTIFFLFITSAPVQVVNDLGVHAGLILRILFILWGAPLVARFLEQPTLFRRTPTQCFTLRFAQALLALGLVTAAWQAGMERGFLPLLNARVVPPVPPFHGAHHLASLYEDVYRAQTSVDAALPHDAVVQSNPIGSYQRIFRLYQLRRQAAGDQSCEAAFGGDPALCNSYVPELLKLFGTHGPRWIRYNKLPITAEGMQLPHLAAVCSQVGLAAVTASNADPVWYYPESWVWRGTLLTGNAHVRVIRCPQAP